MPDLSDRVVMVTGASGNLGQAVAQAFLAAGARLALAERTSDRLAELFPDLIGSSEHLLSGSIDVTDPDSIQRWVDAVLAHFGRIDVLANTVGGYRAGMPVHETPLELWDAMLTLNARSVFLLSRAVVPAMLAQGSGRIIHTARGRLCRARPTRRPTPSRKAPCFGSWRASRPRPGSRASPSIVCCPARSIPRRTARRCPPPTPVAG